MSLSALVTSLRQLSPELLHQCNQAARLELARSEWTMAAHLLATERTGLHRKKGYGDVIAYADKLLDLPRYKACELLRVARSFELMPEISEAFRKGRDRLDQSARDYAGGHAQDRGRLARTGSPARRRHGGPHGLGLAYRV